MDKISGQILHCRYCHTFSHIFCIHVFWNRKLRNFTQEGAVSRTGTVHTEPRSQTKRGVLVTRFPEFPPGNLNMYLLTVYNHIDAVVMSCYWDPDPPWIVKTDTVTILLKMTSSPSGNSGHRLSLTGSDAVFWGKFHWSIDRGLTVTLIFFQYKLTETEDYNNKVVEGDKDMVS